MFVIMRSMTDENGNIIEEKNIIEDKLATQVKDWLLQCEKTLDFVYGQEQRWIERV